MFRIYICYMRTFHRAERRIQITRPARRVALPAREGSTCARAGLSAPPALRRALHTSVRCAPRLHTRDRATLPPLPPLGAAAAQPVAAISPLPCRLLLS